MNDAIQPMIPGRFRVIVGVVDLTHPTLPVAHFDAVREAVGDIIPKVLADLGVQAALDIELGRDDQYHYLEIGLVQPDLNDGKSLFEVPRPADELAVDVAHALTARVRAMLYTLLSEGAISIGELCESAGRTQQGLGASIEVAQALRKAPRSQLVLQANGVQHELDLGELGGVAEAAEPVWVSAIVRAIGPKAAFLERMQFAPLPAGLKVPSSGWLSLTRHTPRATVDQLEAACKGEHRHSLAVQLWIDRVRRTVRSMQPANPR